jgi:hypothetical protein
VTLLISLQSLNGSRGNCIYAVIPSEIISSDILLLAGSQTVEVINVKLKNAAF